MIISAVGLFGGVAAAGAVGRAVLGGPGLLEASQSLSVDGAARAAARAERLGVVPSPTAPTQTTTTATTAPGAPGTPAPPENGRLVFPVDAAAQSYVLDNFGDCRGGGARRHQGVDIVSERGAAVYAVADGVLSGQFLDTGTAGFGWTLRTPDGTSYRYFHLDSFAPGLERGDAVRFGQVIGSVGSSGNLITVGGQVVEDRNNIHLHFEMLRDHSRAVDPLPLIDVPAGISVGPPLKACLHLG